MLAILARASLEGALFAAAVWTFCRVVPRLSPHVRALLWWCVAAKFVVTLVWRAPIGVPVLPPQDAVKSNPILASVSAAPASSGDSFTTDAPSRGYVEKDNRSPVPDLPWTAIVIAVWSLGVGITLARTLRSWFETRGVVSRSVAGDAPLRAAVHELSTLLALRRPAEVRVSAEIESPLITGVLRPVILVPRDLFPTLTAEQQRMTLCHELAHMKRGDLWLGCVPALVERCFFFHPLARLAAREYAFWREAACDDAVLVALGASPQSYGRLLLALGVSRQPATFAAAGAAWSFSNLKRRITMLGSQSSPSFGARMLTAGAIAVAVLAIAPVKAVARTAERAAVVTPIGAAEPGFEAESAEPALALAPMQDRREEERRAQERRDQERREQELRARERERQVREELREDLRERRELERRRGTERKEIVETRARDRDRERDRARDRDRDDDLNFVYFSGENDQTSMSGSRGDMTRARSFRRSNERLLWFRQDGEEYIVRDPRVLREVEELWEPVSRIGSKQGEIGTKQGVIGTEQGKFGAKQGEVGARQGIVGARQGVVAAQLGLLAAREAQGLSTADRREIERQRETLTRDMRALDREMEELGREMRALTPPRGLNSEMSELGRQMSVLGEQMGVASRRAQTGMRELTERAVRSGAAEIAR